jgi:8-hydroxy-5-deazaflavin:NADPH oxidoreductase
MKIGIIGSGVVGQTLGAALKSKGHDIRLGVRSVSEADLDKPRDRAETLREWQAKTHVDIVTFAQAAAFGEIVINATGGGVSLQALEIAGAAAIGEKILIDVSNPGDFSTGTLTSLPHLTNTTSVGEEIQKAFPKAKVVKTLNTAYIGVGVNATLVADGEGDMFIAGNDAQAKATVEALLKRDFNWKNVVDLGDIVGARSMEQFLILWFRLFGLRGTPLFGVKLVG